LESDFNSLRRLINTAIILPSVISNFTLNLNINEHGKST